MMAGCEISSVYAGIAGGHITGFNSNGIIAIKGDEITQSDVDRVVEAARAVAIPMDREVIHVLPQEFIVDGEAGIHNPVGMAGVRGRIDFDEAIELEIYTGPDGLFFRVSIGCRPSDSDSQSQEQHYANRMFDYVHGLQPRERRIE